MFARVIQTCVLAVVGAGLSTFVWANSAPTIDPLSAVIVSIDSEMRVRVIPRDSDQQVPGLRVENPPQGSTFTDNGDGTRTFGWRPRSGDEGSRSVTFVATDSQDNNLQTRRTLSINVVGNDGNSNNNYGIRLDNLNDQTINSGGGFDFQVTPRDDPGRSVPSLTARGLPPGATFDDNLDGTRQFRWTPASDVTGSYTVTFRASDSRNPNRFAEQSVQLNINSNGGGNGGGNGGDNGGGSGGGSNGDNRAPYFVGLYDPNVFLGNSLEIRIQVKDADGDVPGLAVERLPAGATFEDNFDGTRTLRWFPYPVNLGDTYITFYAIDAKDPSLRTAASIKVHVKRDPNNPVNFPPVINGIHNPVIRVGDTLNMKVQPVDPDFTVPSLEVLNPPPGSDFVDNGDGTRTLVWTVGWQHLGSTDVSFRTKDSEDSSLQHESTVRITVVDPASLNRNGERLRTLADRRNFLIGYASVLEFDKVADNQLYRDIAKAEFNMVTPENSHKMGWIQPQRGTFRFEDADRLADFAVQEGMLLHGHPLVWYAQLPGWVQNLDPSQARSVMNEHIRALVGRYRGRVKIWDVVNEALEDDGSQRNSIWYKGMGEGYIREAFNLARREDPNAILIYNDYDVAWFNPKSDAMYQLVKRERDAGTAIDGVGFQMHLGTDFTDYSGVENNLRRFADLGMDIYITEFDVELRGDGNEAKQAEVFRRILEICLNQPRCKAVQAWGYTDRYSWRAPNKPLLLTDSYEAKPAYYEWQRTLRDYNR